MLNYRVEMASDEINLKVSEVNRPTELKLIFLLHFLTTKGRSGPLDGDRRYMGHHHHCTADFHPRLRDKSSACAK